MLEDGEQPSRKQILQRLKKLEEENQKLKQKIGIESDKKAELSADKMSRRDFLKKAGLGTAGLAAASLLPSASALDVKTAKPFDVYTTDTNGGTLRKGLTVDRGQNVSIPNGDLDLKQNNVKNTGKITADTLEATNSITDGNGVTHTGELAELSDVGDVGKFPAMFGDGSDGEVVISSNTTLTENITAQSIVIEDGVTVTINSKTIGLLALDSVEINGTIDASGAGGRGGSGGYAPVGGENGDPGDDGEAATFVGVNGAGGDGGSNEGSGANGAAGAGGGGGSDDQYAGGRGGKSSVKFENAINSINSGFGSSVPNEIVGHTAIVGSGGGGGGAGGWNSGTDSAGSGGNGGNGGGGIAILSPSISGNGTIDVSGEDGQNGGEGPDQFIPAGGGGGGGSGGAIVFLGYSIDSSSITTNISGGAGGAGGSAAETTYAGSGGDGGNGADGAFKTVALP